MELICLEKGFHTVHGIEKINGKADKFKSL